MPFLIKKTELAPGHKINQEETLNPKLTHQHKLLKNQYRNRLLDNQNRIYQNQ